MTHHMQQPGMKAGEGGFIMLTVLVMAVILSALGVIGAQVLTSNERFGLYESRSAEALNIAEAGVNYYLWHLAHNSTDYTDGNATTPPSTPYGPYTHNYYDVNGKFLGTYTLWITPPTNGSTITTVKSIGQVPNFPGTRTILAQLGQPSFANYALLTGTEVWFGPDESSNGPVMSDVGVHMDGTNNGPVYAANATYTPSAEFGGDGHVHNGVWGNGGPSSEWQFPVPSIPFSNVTADYSSCGTQAKSSGTYLASSGKLGYYLQLLSNGKINEYIVKSENSSGITTTTVNPITTLSAPSNGILYVADNVWVQGTGWPGRIDIISGVLPANSSTNTNITIIGNLTYAAKNGSDVIGLIAQNNVQVAPYAASTIEIDGALLAQNGSILAEESGSAKNALTFYGALDSYNFWTWSWVDGNGNVVYGYKTDSNTFDTNLTYGPPACYPTTGTYAVLNWREQLYSP